jgi:glyoxylase-like metal-dependent hydrolase (beta-lactamase superfamily II)
MNAPATMIGLRMPAHARWSPLVHVVLGQNPSLFTGPGTNTYLIGSGRRRLLLDTGDGRDAYLPILEEALAETSCEIAEVVLTHGHPDHIGGLESLRKRFGPLRAQKLAWPGNDERYASDIAPLAEGERVRIEGATLRAVFAPGHAPDHLNFVLEEEQSLFSGDNVLGVGTTVIPAREGSLRAYLASLEKLRALAPRAIYPAHGPRIDDGVAKLSEYIEHRALRERQVLAALAAGPRTIAELVPVIYADYPTALHAPAAQSVGAHLAKLAEEGRVRAAAPAAPDTASPAVSVTWELVA